MSSLSEEEIIASKEITLALLEKADLRANGRTQEEQVVFLAEQASIMFSTVYKGIIKRYEV